jgi:hypothetical protein
MLYWKGWEQNYTVLSIWFKGITIVFTLFIAFPLFSLTISSSPFIIFFAIPATMYIRITFRTVALPFVNSIITIITFHISSPFFTYNTLQLDFPVNMGFDKIFRKPLINII